MASASIGKCTVVRIFRKRVNKTLKLENISIMKVSEGISLDIVLDSDIYKLNIRSTGHPNMAVLSVIIEHHKNNMNREVECKVILMNEQRLQFFQKSGVIKPNSSLVMSTRYSIHDLFNCLMVYYELSCIGWTEESDPQKKTVSFCRTEKLSRDFAQLFTEQTNSDVVLQVGKSEIPVHSQILSARSEVFAAMFGHDMSEKRNRIVKISDIGPMAMHFFLIYIYTGQLEEIKVMRKDTLTDLYAAADKYGVMELKEMCLECMLSDMSVDKVVSHAELAFRHNDSVLQDAVVEFISRNRTILDLHHWQEFENRMPDVAAKILIATSEKNQTY